MKQRYIHILILLLVCAIVFGFKAGENDFWGRHGEARRAEVSREMVETGDWVVPHLNGKPIVTKPPLYYWAAAAIFSVTGQFDELSARIPSIIAGTLGVCVTYLWASAIFSARVGLFAGIILATSFLYGGMARTAGIDMLLVLFTTSALYFFTQGYLKRQKIIFPGGTWRGDPKMFLLSAFFIGLGTMTKNPIGFAVPLLAIVVLILLTRDFKLILDTKPWWLLLVFLLVVLPWFLMVSQRVPNFFDVLNQESLGRYLDPEGTPHLEPFYYYLPALGAFAPWALFLPGTILSLLSKKRHEISRPHLLLIIAVATSFLLFSSVGSKREYYLLPLYPFMAILVAKYWDEYVSARKITASCWTWKAMAIPLAMFGGMLCLIGAALPIAARIYLPAYLVLSVIFGIIFFASGILALRFFAQGNVLSTFGVLSAATLLIYVFVLLTVIPEMNRYRSRKTFFQEVGQIIGEQPIVDYKYEGFDTQFYLQRTLPVLTDEAELSALLAQPESVFVIMTDSQYEKLQSAATDTARQLDVTLQRTWTSAIKPNRHKGLLLLKTRPL